MNRSTDSVSGIPLNVTLHSWPVPPPDTRNTRVELLDDNVSNKNSSVTKLRGSLNATGYIAIEDEAAEDLTDAQTLILTGVVTLVVLAIGLATLFGLISLWNSFHNAKIKKFNENRNKHENREDVERPHELCIPQEVKICESELTAISNEEHIMTPTVQTPKSNGSVITMTLKNNHLIVETEEALEAPTSIRVESCGTTTTYVTPNAPAFGENEKVVNDHGALIHKPPDELEEDKGTTQTGLSQSDLSASSNESENPSYRYGNQTGYGAGAFGYAENTGYECVNDMNTRKKKSNNIIRSPTPSNYSQKLQSKVRASELVGALNTDNLPTNYDYHEEQLQAEQQALGQGIIPPDECLQTTIEKECNGSIDLIS